jgi:hypothetical protein
MLFTQNGDLNPLLSPFNSRALKRDSGSFFRIYYPEAAKKIINGLSGPDYLHGGGRVCCLSSRSRRAYRLWERGIPRGKLTPRTLSSVKTKATIAPSPTGTLADLCCSQYCQMCLGASPWHPRSTVTHFSSRLLVADSIWPMFRLKLVLSSAPSRLPSLYFY